MALGIDIILYDGTTPQANLSNIQAKWWDVEELKDCALPAGKTDVATTDANGHCKLDLSKVSGLSIGASGFLVLYQLNATDHELSKIFAGKVITSDVTGGVEMKYDPGWARPSAWPTMDEPTPGVQKIQALYKVYDIENASNAVTFTAASDYTVDWGDGSPAENFVSGAAATHNFDYTNGEYAIITIAPQSGHNLTSFDANNAPSGMDSHYTSPYLEIRANSAFLATLRVSDIRTLQQCWIGENALTNLSSLFYGCSNLQSVPLFDTSSVTNMSYMFRECSSLLKIPLFDTSSVTDMQWMFYSCTSLISVPKLNTSKVTNMTRMLYSCRKLQSIPLFDTSSVTNMYQMVYACYSLQSIPLFDTSLVTNMYQMVYDCRSLATMQINDASNLTTDPGPLFNNCWGLHALILNGYTGYNLDINACSMGPTALNALYDSLGDGTGMTLTCSANWGYASSDTSKATAKNWTLA